MTNLSLTIRGGPVHKMQKRQSHYWDVSAGSQQFGLPEEGSTVQHGEVEHAAEAVPVTTLLSADATTYRPRLLELNH